MGEDGTVTRGELSEPPETKVGSPLVEPLAPRGDIRAQDRGRGPSAAAIKLAVLGSVVLLAVGYLVFSATRTSAVYYLTVEELRGMGPAAYTQQVRVSGPVATSSIVREGERLSFSIADPSGDLTVVYRGVVPDIFQEGINVVVEGSYALDGTFAAHTLLAMCPSRFESVPQSAPQSAQQNGPIN